MTLIKIAVALVCIIVTTNSYKILGLFPHPGKSHFDVFESLMKGLSKKGHEVTVLSHFPQKSPFPNYTDISLQGSFVHLVDIIDMSYFKGGTREQFSMIFDITNFGKQMCELSLSSEQIRMLLQSKSTFDLIIMEFFNTDCMAGFSFYFSAPLIGICSANMKSWLNARVANPSMSSYIPNILLEYSQPMNFVDRLINTLAYLTFEVIYYTKMEKDSEEVARKCFGEDMPPLRKIIQNASLILINEHFSLNTPKAFVPNVIPVGAIHVGELKALPEVKSLRHF